MRSRLARTQLQRLGWVVACVGAAGYLIAFCGAVLHQWTQGDWDYFFDTIYIRTLSFRNDWGWFSSFGAYASRIFLLGVGMIVFGGFVRNGLAGVARWISRGE